jgi:hypothetical protein
MKNVCDTFGGYPSKLLNIFKNIVPTINTDQILLRETIMDAFLLRDKGYDGFIITVKNTDNVSYHLVSIFKCNNVWTYFNNEPNPIDSILLFQYIKEVDSIQKNIDAFIEHVPYLSRNADRVIEIIGIYFEGDQPERVIDRDELIGDKWINFYSTLSDKSKLYVQQILIKKHIAVSRLFNKDADEKYRDGLFDDIKTIDYDTIDMFDEYGGPKDWRLTGYVTTDDTGKLDDYVEIYNTILNDPTDYTFYKNGKKYVSVGVELSNDPMFGVNTPYKIYKWYNIAGEIHNRPKGEPAIVTSRGDIEYWEHNKKHRAEGEPAVITYKGHKEWWENNVLHRIGGPAKTYSDSEYVEYWEEGLRHREDGPAIYDPEFEGAEYWIRGKLNRIDGPAKVDSRRGIIEYWVDGKRHRIGGPAVINTMTRKIEFWEDNIKIREENMSSGETEGMEGGFVNLTIFQLYNMYRSAREQYTKLKKINKLNN